MEIRKKLSFVICLFVWLSASSQITITSTVTDQIASQKGTGSISLSISGGTSPYTYVWSNSATTQNITSIDAGTYNVTVTDASSATATATIDVLYQVDWENTVNVSTTGTSITKSGGSGTAWDAGASSVSYLPPNTDGYIEFKVISSSGSFYLGFSREDYDLDPNKLNYSFSSSSGTLRVVEGGDIKYSGSAASAGDVLKIERSGNSINYYKNGTLLRAVSTLENIKLIIDENQYTTGSFFSGLHATFGVPFGTYPTVTDIIPDEPYSGAITVNTDGGTSPYTYAWADGPTTGNRTGLAVGTYTVTVTDANSNTVVNTIEVARQVLWTNVTNFTATGNKLVKTSANGLDATAFSQNLLKPNTDGYVEWTVPSRYQNYDFGFSVADDGIFNGTTWQNNRYGLTTINNGGARISQTAASITSLLQPGDVLRVERTGDQIYYKLNGATMAQETTDPSLTLHLRCTGNLQGNIVSDIRTNFNIDFNVYPIVTDITPDNPSSGAIDLNVRGGTSPYTYSWSGGATSATRTGLSLGTYTVTVTDANSLTVAATIEVKSKIEWAASTNVTATYNELVKTGGLSGYSDAYAYSQNKLLANQDGYVEYRLVTKKQNYYMGFNPSKTIAYLQTCRNSFYDHNGSGTFDAYESNNYTLAVATAGPGDVLRIERSGSNILYKVNGVTKRTVATDPNLELSIESFLLYIGTNVDDIKDIRASFGIPYGAYAQLTHVQANEDGTGAITLNVRGGATPYSYAWADGPTTANRTGLNAGTSYTVTVTDANSQTFSTSFTLDYEVEWTNLTNMTTSDSKLTKSGGTEGVYDAGGSSLNYLAPNTDGYLEFVYLDKIKTYLISLGTKLYDFYYGGVVNGLYIHGSMSYYDNNTYTNGPSLNTGDVIRIERTGSQVAYKINGTAVRTVSVDPSIKLAVLTGLSNLGYQSAGVHTSFPVHYNIFADVVDQDPATPNTGSITLNTDGGTSPYTYAWADGATTASRTGLNAGTYSVTVTDAANQTLTATYEVNYHVIWDSYTTGLVTTSNTVQRTSGNDWTAGGGSKNYLPPNQNGFIRYEIPKKFGVYNVIGLSQAGGTSFSYSGINYGFWFNSNNNIYIYENGTNVHTVGTMVPGDVLQVERSGSSIIYKRNGVTVYTSSTDPAKVLGIYVNFYGTSIVYGVSTSFGNVTDPNTLYWTGLGANTNWSNTDNWSHFKGGTTAGVIPDNTTNVEFDEQGLVNCDINQNAEAKAMTITSGYTNTISPGSYDLELHGNFTQQGGTFNGDMGHLTFDEYTNLQGGTFLSSQSTLVIKKDFTDGNYFHNNSGTVSVQGSNVHLNSNSIFYDLDIVASNKLTLDHDVVVDKDLSVDGEIDLNHHGIILNNYLTTAVSGSGKIYSETSDLLSTIDWYIGSGTGTYTIPFGNANGDNVPLSIDVTTAGSTGGHIVLSTYASDASANPNNRPIPYLVRNLNNAVGSDNSLHVVDRYWYAQEKDYTTTPVCTLSMKYADGELGGTNTITETDLKGQKYNGFTWEAPTGSIDDATNILQETGNINGVWVAIENTYPMSSAMALQMTFNTTPSNDEGTQGSAKLNISNGIEPYRIVWSDQTILTQTDWDNLFLDAGVIALGIDNTTQQAMFDAQTANDYRPSLATGNYTVTVSDASSATITNDIDIYRQFGMYYTNDLVVANNIIARINANNQRGGVFYSLEPISTEIDGFFEMGISGTDTKGYFGLQTGNPANLVPIMSSTETSIGYGSSNYYYFYFENGHAYIKENNLNSIDLGATSSNDVYKVAKKGGTVVYAKNNQSVRTVSLGSMTLSLYSLGQVNTSRGNSGGTNTTGIIIGRGVNIVQVSPISTSAQSSVTHADCAQNATGSITFTPPLGYGSTCNWSLNGNPLGASTTLSNIRANTYPEQYHLDYTLTNYIMSNGSPIGNATSQGSMDIALLHKINWETLTNATADYPNEELTSSTSASYAISSNKLSASTSGYFEFKVTSPSNSYRISIGFKDASTSNTSSNSYYFEFSTAVVGSITIKRYNIYDASGTPVIVWQSYSDNDVFRIERNGTAINFYQNGNIVKTISGVSAAVDYVVKAEMSTPNSAKFKNIRSTFACPPTPPGLLPNSYEALLSKTMDGGFYVPVADKLHFQFREEYNDLDQELTYQIVDDIDNTVITVPSKSVKFGDNRYELDLSTMSGISTGHVYTLEVTNEKKENWYLRFKD